MLTVPEIIVAIKAIDEDPALVAMLHANIKTHAPNLCAVFAPKRMARSMDIPDFGTVMAAQCSIFDNWIEYGGKRPARGRPGHYRDRFKVVFSFWKQTDADIDWNSPDYEGIAHLWTSKEIVKRSQGKGGLKLPKALSPDFRARVIDLANTYESLRLGLPYVRDGKTILYNTDATLVAARDGELDGHVVSKVAVDSGDGRFVFEDFRTTTSKGNKLTRNCFAHSRMTTSAKLADKWDATLIVD